MTYRIAIFIALFSGLISQNLNAKVVKCSKEESIGIEEIMNSDKNDKDGISELVCSDKKFYVSNADLTSKTLSRRYNMYDKKGNLTRTIDLNSNTPKDEAAKISQRC